MILDFTLLSLLAPLGGDDDDDLPVDLDPDEGDAHQEDGLFDEGDNNLNDVDLEDDDL